MKPKIIKSNQVLCEAPTIECTCGEICVSKDYGSHLVDIYQELVCESCGQEWDFPSDVALKVVFTKEADINNEIDVEKNCWRTDPIITRR